jgi:hypothetical protein
MGQMRRVAHNLYVWSVSFAWGSTRKEVRYQQEQDIIPVSPALLVEQAQHLCLFLQSLQQGKSHPGLRRPVRMKGVGLGDADRCMLRV